MSFTDYLENELLDQVFGAAAWTAPTGVGVGLSTTTPTDAGGNVTEPPGASGYYRVVATNNKTTWTTSSGGSLANNIAFTFPQATGVWGTITHFVIYDSGISGNALAWGQLNTSKLIQSGDTPEFAAADLSISLD